MHAESGFRLDNLTLAIYISAHMFVVQCDLITLAVSAVRVFVLKVDLITLAVSAVRVFVLQVDCIKLAVSARTG